MLKALKLSAAVLVIMAVLAISGYYFVFGYCHSKTTAWVRKTATPLATCEPDADLKDLENLKDFIGDARVVGAGEATHGTREFFKFKHRLFRYLVTEMGFTSIAFESSLERATLLDKYVKTGEGDPYSLLTNLGFWVYDTEEVFALIQWMREYNADTTHPQKLSFLGFDMQFPQYAISSALDYVGRFDTSFVNNSRIEFASLSNSTCLDTNMQNAIRDTVTTDAFRKQYPKLSAAETESIGTAIDEIIQVMEINKTKFVAATSADEWEWAHQYALVAKQAHLMYMLEQPGHDPDSPDIDNARDGAMASNISWLVGRLQAGGKLMLWGHNGHIARQATNFDSGIKAMGQRLAEEFGDNYISIGFSFDSGAFQSRDERISGGPLREFEVGGAVSYGLDAMFTGTGMSSFICDTRTLPTEGPIHWASSVGYAMRHIGSGFDPESEDEYYVSINPEHAFDAIVFFNKTSRSTPTEWVKARFKLKDSDH